MFDRTSERLATSLAVVAIVLTSSCSAGHLGFGSNKPERDLIEDLRPQEVISHQELTDLLSQPGKLGKRDLLDPFKQMNLYSIKVAKQAVNYLASTKDKDEPRTILNKYSVNDLLGLAKIYAKDYNKAELERRRGICNDFKHKKPESEVSPAMSNDLIAAIRKRAENNWSPEERLKHQKVYLDNYCSWTMSTFLSGYQDHLHRDIYGKLKPKDKDVLAQFNKNFIAYKNIMRNAPHNENHLQNFIGHRGEEEMDNVKKSCKKLIALMSDQPVALPHDSNLSSQLKLCQSVKSESDSLPKLRLISGKGSRVARKPASITN